MVKNVSRKRIVAKLGALKGSLGSVRGLKPREGLGKMKGQIFDAVNNPTRLARQIKDGDYTKKRTLSVFLLIVAIFTALAYVNFQVQLYDFMPNFSEIMGSSSGAGVMGQPIEVPGLNAVSISVPYISTSSSLSLTVPVPGGIPYWIFYALVALFPIFLSLVLITSMFWVTSRLTRADISFRKMLHFTNYLLLIPLLFYGFLLMFNSASLFLLGEVPGMPLTVQYGTALVLLTIVLSLTLIATIFRTNMRRRRDW